jgi:hypothetical protein
MELLSGGEQAESHGEERCRKWSRSESQDREKGWTANKVH